MIYRSILTNEGKRQLDQAIATGSQVNWNRFAVGDGGGSFIDPLPTMTDLVNRQWSGDVTGVFISDYDPGQVTFNGVIPTSVTGFTIREVGILDSNDTLVAISRSNFIELNSDNETEIEINFDLIVRDAEEITVVFEDSTHGVTKDYVDGLFNSAKLYTDKEIEKLKSSQEDSTKALETSLSEITKQVQENKESTTERINELNKKLEEEKLDKETRMSELETSFGDLQTSTNNKLESFSSTLEDSVSSFEDRLKKIEEKTSSDDDPIDKILEIKEELEKKYAALEVKLLDIEDLVNTLSIPEDEDIKSLFS